LWGGLVGFCFMGVLCFDGAKVGRILEMGGGSLIFEGKGVRVRRLGIEN